MQLVQALDHRAVALVRVPPQPEIVSVVHASASPSPCRVDDLPRPLDGRRFRRVEDALDRTLNWRRLPPAIRPRVPPPFDAIV